MRFWIFVIGVICGVFAVWAGAEIYFRGGYAPVAVDAAPLPFEKSLANAALHKKVADAAKVPSPIQPTEENLLAGARNYRQDCVFCHSLPGKGKTDLEKAMYPPPPELLSGKGVTDDPVGRTHWVVQHGIRLTGMPSFDRTYSDQQLWQISLLLANAHNLPASVQSLLSQPDTVPLDALMNGAAPVAQR